MANGVDPVNILLSNHQLLVVLFVAVAWVLKKIGLTGKKPAAKPAPGGHLQSARTGTDDEVAERTRRVQEDVRRKIAERRAAATPPPVPPRIQVATADEREPEDEAIEFARQQKLEGQMRALDAARAAAVQQAAAISSATALPIGGPAGQSAQLPISPWLAELRDPSGVRRAILLREILGPPISLKTSA